MAVIDIIDKYIIQKSIQISVYFSNKISKIVD